MRRLNSYCKFWVKDSFSSVVAWINTSGIQSEEGGFYAWYDATKDEYSYLYSEITGYGVTTLLFLYRLYGDEIFLRKAEKAGQWIIEKALHPCGGVRTRLYHSKVKANPLYSFSEENIFSFDTGMVLYGMINLYHTTKKENFLKISVMLADFLLTKMQNKDGSFAPMYNAKKNAIIFPKENKWSNQAGGFHAKVALGLVDLFTLTREERYREAALKICDYALTTQEPCGRFITDKISSTTHIHPHCYAAEGLWYAGSILSVSRFISSAKRAMQWIFKYISVGSVNELYSSLSDNFNMVQRSDIIAQALRLGVIFSLDAKLAALKSELLTYQYANCDSPHNGGFLFTKESGHINSWCGMFSLQALYFYNNRHLSQRKPALFI